MLLLISVSAVAMNKLEHKEEKRTFDWEINIEGHEPGGKWDYVIFGEKPDASDIVDQYDVPKCPPPPNGYVRMILINNELPYPYNTLWFEYRKSPDTYKSWTLLVQWVPQTGYDDTEITLTWDLTGRVEYKHIMLNNINMRRENSFEFTCQAYTPTVFEIVASRHHRLSITNR